MRAGLAGLQSHSRQAAALQQLMVELPRSFSPKRFSFFALIRAV
jgi:hypothetical protein